MAVARFMATPEGRLLRIAFGIVLLALGSTVVNGALGTALSVFGIFPIVAGVFNVCPISPLIGVPFRGKDVLEKQR